MNIAEDAIHALAELGSQIRLAEKKHRAKFLEEESEACNTARILVDGMISSIFLKTCEPIKGISPEGEYQLLLGASFIRTHLLLHDLILNGQIIDSHCLLRKQLEQLARLQELEEKTVQQLSGITPNIKAAGGSVGRIYGAQSQIAHFAVPDVGYSLLQTQDHIDHACVTAFAVYSENSVYAMNSRLFLAIQFGSWFIDRLTRWYPGKDLETLENQFIVAAESSADAGIIKRKVEGLQNSDGHPQ